MMFFCDGVNHPTIIRILYLFSTLYFCASSVFADNSSEEKVKKGDSFFIASIATFSRYEARGRIISDDHGAIQGSLTNFNPLTKNTNMLFGIWGTNASFGDANSEFQIYGGATHKWNKLFFRGGLVYFMYPKVGSNLNYNFHELFGEVTYDFDYASLIGLLQYAPTNFFGKSGPSSHYVLEAKIPLIDKLNFSMKIGKQEVDKWQKFGFRDYSHWGFGLNYVYNNFDFNIRYKNTNISRKVCPKDWCNSALIFGVSKSFLIK